jgi:DNA-binding beta-propeller fold protein YncE
MKNILKVRVTAALSSMFSAAVTIVLVASLPARADNLFVANGAGNSIGEFPTTGGAGTVFASGSLLNNPNGLAFDSAGSLFVDNYAGNNIIKYTPNGVGSVFASAGLSSPYGMAFDGSGNLYVANAGTLSGGGYIEEYTSGGVGSLFVTGVQYPTGVAINGGYLYVAQFNNNSIVKYGLNPGSESTFTATGLSSPQGIAFDTSGNLYVANSGNGQAGSGYIEKYNSSGVGSVFASGLNFPYGLAFDSAGDLFTSSRGTSGNEIYEFSPTGAETILTTDVSGPEFLAIKATPEPATWALLCLGAGILLYIRRRQACAARFPG